MDINTVNSPIKEYGIQEKDLQKYIEIFCWIENTSKDKVFDIKYSFSTEKELANIVECMIRKLSEKKQKVIKMWFGIEQNKKLTNLEIANILNISSSRVSAIKDEIHKEFMKPSFYNMLVKEPILTEGIEIFDFTTYTRNALRRNGIRKATQLIDIVKNEPEKLMRLKGIGVSSAQEILSKLKKINCIYF